MVVAFGFSVGDFIAVGQLAYEVWSACEKHPSSDYRELANTCASVHLVVTRLVKAIEDANRPFDDDDASNLAKTLLSCKKTLVQLQGKLDTYQNLSSKRRAVWDRIKFGREDFNDIRSRLNIHLGAMSAFANGIQLGAMGRIEQRLAEIAIAINRGDHEPSLISDDALEDGDTWDQLRRELLAEENITAEELEANREEIKAALVRIMSEMDIASGTLGPDDSMSVVAMRRQISEVESFSHPASIPPARTAPNAVSVVPASTTNGPASLSTITAARAEGDSTPDSTVLAPRSLNGLSSSSTAVASRPMTGRQADSFVAAQKQVDVQARQSAQTDSPSTDDNTLIQRFSPSRIVRKVSISMRKMRLSIFDSTLMDMFNSGSREITESVPPEPDWRRSGNPDSPWSILRYEVEDAFGTAPFPTFLSCAAAPGPNSIEIFIQEYKGHDVTPLHQSDETVAGLWKITYSRGDVGVQLIDSTAITLDFDPKSMLFMHVGGYLLCLDACIGKVRFLTFDLGITDEEHSIFSKTSSAGQWLEFSSTQDGGTTSTYDSRWIALGTKLFVVGGLHARITIATVDLSDAKFSLQWLYPAYMAAKEWYYSRKPLPHGPIGRVEFSLVAWNGQLYIFGGVRQSSKSMWSTVIFNDCWCYDPEANEWTELNCTGQRPSRRFEHGAVVVGSRMYIYGGIPETNSKERLRDLFVLDLTTFVWTELAVPGKFKPGLGDRNLALAGKDLLLFGDDARRLNVLDFARVNKPFEGGSSASDASFRTA